VTRPEALALLSLPSHPDPPEARELRRAYRKAALRSHPDRGGSESDMKRVNEAHEVLSGKPGGLFEIDPGPRARKHRRGPASTTKEEQAGELWICRQCFSVYPGGGLGTRCNAVTAYGVCTGEVERYVGRR